MKKIAFLVLISLSLCNITLAGPEQALSDAEIGFLNASNRLSEARVERQLAEIMIRRMKGLKSAADALEGKRAAEVQFQKAISEFNKAQSILDKAQRFNRATQLGDAIAEEVVGLTPREGVPPVSGRTSLWSRITGVFRSPEWPAPAPTVVSLPAPPASTTCDPIVAFIRGLEGEFGNNPLFPELLNKANQWEISQASCAKELSNVSEFSVGRPPPPPLTWEEFTKEYLASREGRVEAWKIEAGEGMPGAAGKLMTAQKELAAAENLIVSIEAAQEAAQEAKRMANFANRLAYNGIASEPLTGGGRVVCQTSRLVGIVGTTVNCTLLGLKGIDMVQGAFNAEEERRFRRNYNSCVLELTSGIYINGVKTSFSKEQAQAMCREQGLSLDKAILRAYFNNRLTKAIMTLGISVITEGFASQQQNLIKQQEAEARRQWEQEINQAYSEQELQQMEDILKKSRLSGKSELLNRINQRREFIKNFNL